MKQLINNVFIDKKSNNSYIFTIQNLF